MKKSSFLLAALLIISFIGCDTQDQPVLDKIELIKVIEGRLVFETPKHFAISIAGVGQGTIKILNDKLAGFDYQSYASKGKSSNVNDLSILGLRAFQVLLNENKEVQIAGKIFRIDHGVTTAYSKEGVKLGTSKSSISVFDQSKSRFVEQGEGNPSTRQFGLWQYYNIGAPACSICIPDPNVTPYQVRDRFTRASWSEGWWFWEENYANYYYNWETVMRFAYTSLPIAEYFVLTGGVCLCEYPSGVPLREYYYNMSSQTYDLGYSSTSYESNYDVGFTIAGTIKMPTNQPYYIYTH